MSPLEALGFTLGASFASGLNLYATAATLGLLDRFEVIELPERLAFLSEPVVLGVALALYVVEFVADKIPAVDNVWDFIHTFIRPPAAALLAYTALGDVPEAWRLAGTMVAGGVALSSHGAKASTRGAVNTSPEPVSNWVLSLGEDGIAIFLSWLAATHPVLTFVLVVVLVAAAVGVAVVLWRFFRRLFRKPVGRPQTEPPRA